MILAMQRRLCAHLPKLILTRCPVYIESSRTWVRQSSTLTNLHHELTSRPLHIIYDYMTPTPSHLLTTSLCDLFSSQNFPQLNTPISKKLPYIRHQKTRYLPAPLPQGHHLVYFPAAVPHHALLPDGTDNLHSPMAAPTLFSRRLWAGGSLEFKRTAANSLHLDGTRAVCIEAIKDVVIKGPLDQEKVFVHIERKMAHVFPLGGRGREFNNVYADEEDIVRRVWNSSEAAVVEKREIVFIRGNKKESKGLKGSERKVVKPSHKPDHSIGLMLPPTLLFRFSALTFNAHAIHLDPGYCQEVEGHRGLLVHGPLTLVLMLLFLRSRLGKAEEIKSFSYRNLAPLYANEKMRLCLKQDREKTEIFEVWIENSSGGYAVKGTAIISEADVDPDISADRDSASSHTIY